MRKRRIVFLALAILFMLFVIMGRLMQLQLFATEHFSSRNINLIYESVKQRSHEILINDGRGDFLDASGQPLSYEEKTVLVLFPFLKNIDWDKASLAEIMRISESEISSLIEEADKPFIYGQLTSYEAEQVRTLNIPGVIAISKEFPSTNNSAAQLLGLTGENKDEFQKRYPDKKGNTSMKIGITGLQESFDPFLIPENPSKLIFHVDGKGAPLFGIDVKLTGENNPFYPLRVKTTIERNIQDRLEQLLDYHNIVNGGALLLNIETNSIIASASRPTINESAPFSDDGTKNKMFEQHIPGSVFKTVVAAGAIEEELIKDDEVFNCSLDIRGEQAERDLGELKLDESFSRSCNLTFAELAKRLQKEDPNMLEKYASELGLIGNISWKKDLFHYENFKQFSHHQGRIFTEESSRKDLNYVGQTGIGQHEVRVSPLHVANMLATIARGGEMNAIKVASEIQYGDGSIMYKFPDIKVKDSKISPSTFMQLQSLLRHVVSDNEGTGRYFQDLPFEIAGKSGTGETGIFKDEEQLHNKWFAGYFPFKSPKYALVVVNLGVPINEGGVNLLFADIVNMIYEESHDAVEASKPIQ